MKAAVADLRDRADAVRGASLAGASIVAGAAALLARPALIGRGAGPLALLYSGVLAVGIGAAPSDPALARIRQPALPSGQVILLGAVALVAARFVVGSSVPSPDAPLLGALGLNALAAVAEEALFRRLLYGRLVRWGAPVAVALSAAAFAAIHVPAYGTAALWVDLGAGVLLGWQRWASGGWGAPAATHVVANVLAVLP
jgi:membrane protease YdiL (CAAX protease family)